MLGRFKGGFGLLGHFLTVSEDVGDTDGHYLIGDGVVVALFLGEVCRWVGSQPSRGWRRSSFLWLLVCSYYYFGDSLQ